MARIFPTRAARADLSNIREFSIDQYGGDVADSYFFGFDEAFNLLAEHPLAGPSMPELGKGIRCLVHRRHRILYRLDGDIVLIIRVIHHAMDAKRVLGKGAR